MVVGYGAKRVRRKKKVLSDALLNKPANIISQGTSTLNAGLDAQVEYAKNKNKERFIARLNKYLNRPVKLPAYLGRAIDDAQEYYNQHPEMTDLLAAIEKMKPIYQVLAQELQEKQAAAEKADTPKNSKLYKDFKNSAIAVARREREHEKRLKTRQAVKAMRAAAKLKSGTQTPTDKSQGR